MDGIPCVLDFTLRDRTPNLYFRNANALRECDDLIKNTSKTVTHTFTKREQHAYAYICLVCAHTCTCTPRESQTRTPSLERVMKVYMGIHRIVRLPHVVVVGHQRSRRWRYKCFYIELQHHKALCALQRCFVSVLRIYVWLLWWTRTYATCVFTKPPLLHMHFVLIHAFTFAVQHIQLGLSITRVRYVFVHLTWVVGSHMSDRCSLCVSHFGTRNHLIFIEIYIFKCITYDMAILLLEYNC